MRAIFRVNRSFLLSSRSLFVLAGAVAEGEVRSGMSALVPFNASTSMACHIEGVEFLRIADTEEVALTVRYVEPDEGILLQGLNIQSEDLIVTDEQV